MDEFLFYWYNQKLELNRQKNQEIKGYLIDNEAIEFRSLQESKTRNRIAINIGQEGLFFID